MAGTIPYSSSFKKALSPWFYLMHTNVFYLPESKSAKKNKKRRAGGKLSSQDKGSAGFEIEEDVSVAVVTPPPRPPPRPPSPDPIADLKRQIEDAKASKVTGRTLI